ncbi:MULTISPECIES: CRISPR-associated helicase Cas3' [unclassified Streptomyces]|uniref:CRISPR-associated helicase Cas3' n=1 Tax=unclassified Streptomyces TaxID=2593676 RepID=UPI000DD7D370|nr:MULTISPECIES: CRISPR-associated helicase Cas3' [unclassified Streptomyces]QZZ25439.1 CRISPR-associated helicase Cas3' [Streptomyces sp. ST1015]
MGRPVVEVDESLWGKSRGLDRAFPVYPLVRHLLDAAAMALFLWDRYLSVSQRRAIARGLRVAGDLERARGVTALCAGLHDVGKASGFQLCDVRGREGLSGVLRQDMGRIGVERMPHEVAGMRAAASVLAALGFGEGGMAQNDAMGRVAEIIGGHHGRFYEARALHPVNMDLLGGPAWAAQREAHARAVSGVLGAPQPPGEIEAPAAVLITGVVILADWLVSQEGYLRRRQRKLDVSLTVHFEQSLVDAEELARDAGLLTVEVERKEFSEAYGIQGEANPLQRSVAEELAAVVGAKADVECGERCGGIALVTAAPGDGKSETAMEIERVLAERFGTRGFAFLLPTMATSDQMYRRVSGVVSRLAGDEAGLTLTHSMAWLNSAYAQDTVGEVRVVTCEGDDEDDADGPRRWEIDMRPKRWLRGAKRPLLAQFTVGTVDQALMGVLPVRHNALRLLALSGKTFILDEAHAYDPYMQVLLGRLLNWLGRYGTPVVLLSATLPVSVSDQLIKQYLKGTGMRNKELKGRTFEAPYPGWLYVDAADGECAQISGARHEEQAAARAMSLDVQVEPVVHGIGGGSRSRLAVVERLLEPVLGDERGCALVVCNTVPEAQDTYRHLRDLLDRRRREGGEEVQLLHARFPGDQREQRTQEITDGLGRQGPRPGRRIVVATQVVEQSLDLDADIVISDLAPLALLLQRAGRCWRHETWWARHGRPHGHARPAWATNARLVVLDPVAAGRGVPKEWGEVYAEFLLRTTSTTLGRYDGRSIAIPGDVQDLVEEVHGHDDMFVWKDPVQSAAYTAYRGQELADRSVGNIVVIHQARLVPSLHKLHHLKGTEDEWEAATRLGADAVRLLCAYRHADGRTTLDPEGTETLPGTGGDVLTPAGVRAVMARTMPVNADWFKGELEHHRAPDEWSEHPRLGDLVVLRQPVADGQVQPVTVVKKSLRLDPELGLVRV